MFQFLRSIEKMFSEVTKEYDSTKQDELNFFLSAVCFPPVSLMPHLAAS